MRTLPLSFLSWFSTSAIIHFCLSTSSMLQWWIFNACWSLQCIKSISSSWESTPLIQKFEPFAETTISGIRLKTLIKHARGAERNPHSFQKRMLKIALVSSKNLLLFAKLPVKHSTKTYLVKGNVSKDSGLLLTRIRLSGLLGPLFYLFYLPLYQPLSWISQHSSIQACQSLWQLGDMIMSN